MSCLNCLDCADVQDLPKCYSGTITFGNATPTNVYTLRAEKANGSAYEYQATADGGGDVKATLANFADIQWWAPGTYKVSFLDSNREAATFDDTSAPIVQKECVALVILDAESSTNNDITLIYG